MAINTLTDQDCRKATPGEKTKKLFDGYGMFLAVLPSGTKSWRMAYKDAYGKPQTHVIGPYPLVTLADARVRRDALRLKLLDGQSIKPEAPQLSLTVSEAVASYWDQRKDVGDDYKNHAIRACATYIEKFIGTRPIGSVTREQLLELLMKMNSAGIYVYAKKVRMWMSQVFEWAMQHDKNITSNPAAAINPKVAFSRKPVEGLAHLPLKDVKGFMDRMNLEGDIQSVMACKLLALTWLRTGELRRVKWEHIEGDILRLPPSVMTKGKREHLVPLSAAALHILHSLRFNRRGSEYILPSHRDIKKPISENEVTALIHRLGYKDRMTGHGWRKVGSTWANEMEFNRDHIEMQLAHSDGSVRGVYNSAEYLNQRRVMMQAYAVWLNNPDASGIQGTQTPSHSAA